MNQQDKKLYMTVLMTPDMANFSGRIHGGSLLKLLDQVAYACAARYCKSYVVTASLDQVFFREPIHVGELVTFKANVNYTGRTSMEIGVRVVAENIQSQVPRTPAHEFLLFHHGSERRKRRSEINASLRGRQRSRTQTV